jgi:hypothetical protein
MAILAEHIGIQDLYKTSTNLDRIVCKYAHDNNFATRVSVSVAATVKAGRTYRPGVTNLLRSKTVNKNIDAD